MTAYALSCPNCGSALTPHVGVPSSAPWLSGPPDGCGRGWWVAELSTTARTVWRHREGDFGYGPERGLLQGLSEEERVAARRRGTSCLPEHLPLIDDAVLTWLAGQAQVVAILAQQAIVAANTTTTGSSTTTKQQAIAAAQKEIAVLLGLGGVALEMVALIAAEMTRRGLPTGSGTA